MRHYVLTPVISCVAHSRVWMCQHPFVVKDMAAGVRAPALIESISDSSSYSPSPSIYGCAASLPASFSSCLQAKGWDAHGAQGQPSHPSRGQESVGKLQNSYSSNPPRPLSRSEIIEQVRQLKLLAQPLPPGKRTQGKAESRSNSASGYAGTSARHSSIRRHIPPPCTSRPSRGRSRGTSCTARPLSIPPSRHLHSLRLRPGCGRGHGCLPVSPHGLPLGGFQNSFRDMRPARASNDLLHEMFRHVKGGCDCVPVESCLVEICDGYGLTLCILRHAVGLSKIDLAPSIQMSFASAFSLSIFGVVFMRAGEYMSRVAAWRIVAMMTALLAFRRWAVNCLPCVDVRGLARFARRVEVPVIAFFFRWQIRPASIRPRALIYFRPEPFLVGREAFNESLSSCTAIAARFAQPFIDHVDQRQEWLIADGANCWDARAGLAPSVRRQARRTWIFCHGSFWHDCSISGCERLFNSHVFSCQTLDLFLDCGAYELGHVLPDCARNLTDALFKLSAILNENNFISLCFLHFLNPNALSSQRLDSTILYLSRRCQVPFS
jgi:hypothetical protein